jgi:arylsulfatase B
MNSHASVNTPRNLAFSLHLRQSLLFSHFRNVMKKLYQYPVNESCKVVVTLNLFTLLATLGAALPATAATTNAADNHAARPNIICILCDDLGYADVGFNAEHFGVQTDVKTPQIDAMARDGVIFPQAYVAHPFCGPSRMALFTGRMPHCFGGQKNLPDEAKNLRDYNSRGVPESEVLLSTVLQQAGYRTACIGKWHMGTAEPFQPNTRGFDEFFGFLGGGHQYFPSVTDKVKPKVNDYQYFLKRNQADYKSPEGAYLTDMLSEEAAGFIKNAAAADQPFFLYLAYNAPHSPLQGKTEDLQQLYPQHKPTNPQNGINYRDYEARQNYVAMVYAVDRGVGLLATTLADPNGDGNTTDSLTENTLVVFLSDNGGKILQAANNAPLLDDKGSTHEGGIRVPMFMHWPSQLKEETVFNHPVLALDLYPTLAALGKANLPSGKQLDGKDIWGDIKTDKNPHPNEPLFWLRHHGAGNEVAIRHDNLKAYRKNFGRWQVFDVVGDASETTDLVDSQATFLETRVAEGAAWSKTLKSPGWHDTEAALRAWQTNDLPKYDETFRLR